ncbi:hypothetical protein [Prauserella flavalba]|uniref:hypothetical protein n=1 Tax=Prauserella flavalba TaxID=1477506 RepID=UPI001FE78749|nr:hypothetical protein [Prauserella flavalba]
MSPARYELRVSGRMSELAQDAVWDFGALTVVPASPETIIYGRIIDAAQLHGLLALLEDLGLHIVSVHRLPPPDEEAREPDPAG